MIQYLYTNHYSIIPTACAILCQQLFLGITTRGPVRKWETREGIKDCKPEMWCSVVIQ